MDILVSTLCDFAADYQGKLCIQGGFDSLVAIKINFPVPAFPEGASFFTRNLIMNFQGLRFEKPGNYSIDLTVDGELASRVPFRVVQVQEEAAQA